MTDRVAPDETSTSPTRATARRRHENWLLLAFAVTMCSSGGALFLLIPEVPPFLRTSWRHWCSFFLQLWPFVREWQRFCLKAAAEKGPKSAEVKDAFRGAGGATTGSAKTSPEDGDPKGPGIVVANQSFVAAPRAKLEHQTQKSSENKTETGDIVDEQVASRLALRAQYFKGLPYIILSGCILGGRHGAWVWSLEHTSLLHSLMCINTFPLLLHLGKWAVFLYFFLHLATLTDKSADNQKEKKSAPPPRPSRLESGGLFVSLFGVIALLLGPEVFGSSSSEADKKGNPATLLGDMMALLSAVGMCFYLVIGKALRTWCPIFLYTTPVVLIAAVVCSVFSVITEGAGFTNTKATNLFGFFLDGKYFWISLFLGGGAGVAGHTVLNYLLKWMSPTVVATSMLLEPVVGTAIGLALGVVSPDIASNGVWTLVGVPVVLLGVGMLVRSEENERRRAEIEQNMAQTV